MIQALLSCGPLQEKDFHSLFSGITGKIPGTNQQSFNDHLLKINKELSLVQFELRACRNQYDGKVYYGIVNNVADEQSKLGTKYTGPQIAFYKAIIEAIAQDATAKGVISNIDALNIRLENQVANGAGSQSQDSSANIPPAFKNFSMSQKEKALEDLVQDQWLCSTSDSKIGLGLRSFLDLRGWFRNNDVPACDVCNEAGVKAVLCNNEGCLVRMHQYCLNKKFSQRKVEKVCPGCNIPWVHSVVKAEPVEEEENIEPGEPSQNLPLRPPKRTRVRACRADDSNAPPSQHPISSTEARRTTQHPISSTEARRTTRSSSRMR